MPEPGVVAAPFSWRIRVYWEDTDAGGVVYHAGYVRFLERGRSEWLRTLGVDQARLRDEAGLGFVVRAMQIGFMVPARLDDELDVSVAVSTLRAASMVFEQRIRRVADGRELVGATVRAACVNIAGMRPAAIPPQLKARISANR